MPQCQSHWSYDLLKAEVSKQPFSKEQLEYYKALFKDEIQSTRRFACISSIDDLLDCLERRDALSEYNIEPLRSVAECIEDDNIEIALEKYEVPSKPYDLQNEFALLRVQESVCLKGQVKKEVCKPEPKPTIIIEFSQEKRNNIYQLIANEIGRDWRSLGRELLVRAGDLDKIQDKYPNDLHSKVYAVLEVFENDPRHNPREHYSLLCEALDGCKRKDMRRDVQKIMSY